MRLLLMVAAGGEIELPIPGSSPDDVNRTADEILSRPEYQVPDKTFVDTALSWIGDRIGDVLGWFGDRLAGLGGGGDGAGGPLGAIAVLIALGVVVYVIVKIAQSPQAAKRKRKTEPDVVYGTEARASSERWRSEAERLRAEGDLEGAVRCYFQAAAADIVDHHVILDQPGRTSGELRRAVDAQLPAAAPRFGPFVDLFERVWYGGGTATNADVDSAAVATDEVAAAAIAFAPADEFVVPA